jgi:hypothetical protein
MVYAMKCCDFCVAIDCDDPLWLTICACRCHLEDLRL